MNHTWTADEANILKEMWDKGHSASEIVERIPGVTRNAVIGKAFRMGLREHVNAPNLKASQFSKPKPVKTIKPIVRDVRRAPSKPDPKNVAQVTRIVERVINAPAPKPLNFSLMELGAHDCRWPVEGEKAQTLFCGHNTEAGSSYCPCHKRMSMGRGTESERNAVYAGKAA